MLNASQDHFVLVVSEFLYIPWKYLREQVASRMSARDENTCTPSITIAASETFQACITEYLKEQVRAMLSLENRVKLIGKTSSYCLLASCRSAIILQRNF